MRFLVAAWLVASLSVAARAQSIGSLNELGVSMQFARAVTFTPVEAPRRNFQLTAVRWSTPLDKILLAPVDPERWRLVVEPNAGSFSAPAGGAILGTNVGLRWLPFAISLIRPYLGVGGGLFYTWFPLLDSRFNFVLYGSAGADVFLTKRLALEASLRLHHISNGGIRKPNVGINTELVSIGLAWYY